MAKEDANQATAEQAADNQAPTPNAAPREPHPAATDKRVPAIAKKLGIAPETIFGVNNDGTVIVTEDGRKVSVPA